MADSDIIRREFELENGRTLVLYATTSWFEQMDEKYLKRLKEREARMDKYFKEAAEEMFN